MPKCFEWWFFNAIRNNRITSKKPRKMGLFLYPICCTKSLNFFFKRAKSITWKIIFFYCWGSSSINRTLSIRVLSFKVTSWTGAALSFTKASKGISNTLAIFIRVFKAGITLPVSYPPSNPSSNLKKYSYGSNSSNRMAFQSGSFSKRDFSHSKGSMPLSLQVPKSE